MIVLDDLASQYGLVDLTLENASERLISHLSTGVLGVENPILSEAAL